MRFNYKRFFRHIYLFLFESKKRGIRVTPQRVLILLIFLFILTPIFLTSASIGWFLDKMIFPKFRTYQVKQPLFIIGNPRSGTTFLHRLIARDEANFCHIQTWELGFAPTITQRKILWAITEVDKVIGAPLKKFMISMNDRIFGTFDDLHPTGLFQAEEDDLILLYVWSSMFSLGVFPFPDEVMPYVLDFDQIPEERKNVMPFYEGGVKRHMFAHGANGRHYLSKNPVFSSRVDALYETFPDARFVYLIRNPLNMLGSLGSYVRAVWSGFQGAEARFPYDEWIWNVANKWYRYTIERLEQAPPESYIIVRFNDLTTNPRDSVHRIYEHFGLELSDAFDEVLEEANVRARQYKSRHNYTFDNMNFSREMILEEYADLFERFGFETTMQ